MHSLSHCVRFIHQSHIRLTTEIASEQLSTLLGRRLARKSRYSDVAPTRTADFQRTPSCGAHIAVLDGMLAAADTFALGSLRYFVAGRRWGAAAQRPSQL